MYHLCYRKKKTALAAFSAPFFPYFKETTVQEDKCDRSLYLDFEEVLMRRAAISLEFLHRFLVPPLLLGSHLIFTSLVFYKILKHDIISLLKRKLINTYIERCPAFSVLYSLKSSSFFYLQYKEPILKLVRNYNKINYGENRFISLYNN